MPTPRYLFQRASSLRLCIHVLGDPRQYQCVVKGSAGPTSWTCNLCSHTGPYTEKGRLLAIMLGCHHFEILSNFRTGNPHFHFTLRPSNYVARPN